MTTNFEMDSRARLTTFIPLPPANFAVGGDALFFTVNTNSAKKTTQKTREVLLTMRDNIANALAEVDNLGLED